MKKFVFLILSVVSLVVFVMMSCDKRNGDGDAVFDEDTSLYKLDVISNRPVTVEGSEIVLPTGSRLRVAKDGYSIDVTLPEGYGFLYYDSTPAKISKRPLPVLFTATYKCKCSGTNSCQVIYQEQAGGFGCLHQSCSGSCTGSFVNASASTINGVVNLTNADVTNLKDLPFTPAALNAEGKTLFFENPEVQKKIAEQYDIMYRFKAKPDFRKIDPVNESLRDFVFVKVQLYGVAFYMLGPAEFSSRSDLFDLSATKASCKCGEASGVCTTGSGGFLGWKVYYCTGGCKGCEMTVTKSAPSLQKPGNTLPFEPVRSDLSR